MFSPIWSYSYTLHTWNCWALSLVSTGNHRSVAHNLRDTVRRSPSAVPCPIPGTSWQTVYWPVSKVDPYGVRGYAPHGILWPTAFAHHLYDSDSMYRHVPSAFCTGPDCFHSGVIHYVLSVMHPLYGVRLVASRFTMLVV